LNTIVLNQEIENIFNFVMVDIWFS